MCIRDRYIGNVSTLFTPRWSHFIFLYADDIILLAPATELERLLHICEKELEWLDMSINFKKSMSNVLTLSVSQIVFCHGLPKCVT